MYYIQANDNFAWHAKERAPVKFKYSESNQWWGQFASEWIFLRISTGDSPPIFFSLLASYDRIVFCMGTFSPYKVWSNDCTMQVQTKNQPEYCNLKFFLPCPMKTADCTMFAHFNAYEQGGPGTADGWMHQYPTKVLQLRNWKMSRLFFSQMWVLHRAKKGMFIKDLNAKH